MKAARARSGGTARMESWVGRVAGLMGPASVGCRTSRKNQSESSAGLLTTEIVEYIRAEGASRPTVGPSEYVRELLVCLCSPIPRRKGNAFKQKGNPPR